MPRAAKPAGSIFDASTSGPDRTATLTRAQLEAIGTACFGNRWQTDIAEAVGVNDKTVRRWLSGESAMSPEMSRKLLSVLYARAEALAALARTITL